MACAALAACGRTGLDDSAGNSALPASDRAGNDALPAGRDAGHDAAPDLAAPPVRYALQCFPEVAGQALRVAMSRDARWFLFSDGSVDGGHDNGPLRLFDRDTRRLITVVAAPTTLYSLALSGDGRIAAYGMGPGNSEQIYVWERETGRTTIASVDAAGLPGDGENGMPSISNDGRRVVFYSRSQNLSDPPPFWQGGVLLRDRALQTTVQVSVNDQGVPGNDFSVLPAVSDDGRFVAFQSVATNLGGPSPSRTYTIFLRDMVLGHTDLVSRAPSVDAPTPWAIEPQISADGSLVAFASGASSLDDTGAIFVWERTTQQLTAVTEGFRIDGNYPFVGLSVDGRYVAFGSTSSQIVPGDGNDSMDGFVYDRGARRTVRRTNGASGLELARGGQPVALSGDGKTLAFVTPSLELSDGVHAVLCLSIEVPAD